MRSWTRSFLTLPLLLLMLSLTLASCDSRKEREEVVTINIGMDPPSLSCQAATKAQVITVIRHIGEGLTRINPMGEIEPALAEKIIVLDDGLRYQFVIRKEAVWSPGVPVTAQDFERSFKQMMTKQVVAPMGDQLFSIKNARPIYQGKMSETALGVHVLSDREIEIELEERNPVFLHQLSTPIFFPVPESYTPDVASKVSCGAYYLKEWQREKHLILEKNPNYWDSEHIRIPRLVFTTIADAHTQFAMYNDHQLDWCGTPFLDIPQEAEPELEKEGVLHRFKEASVHMLAFNTRKGMVFNNLKLRRAFSLAVDRQTLVKHGIYNGAPAASFVPPMIIGQDTPYFPYYDEDQAKELFKEAITELGYTQESLPKIRFLYFNKAPIPRRVQAIQANWYRLFGIQIELVGLEWQMLVQTLQAGDFDVATASWVADFPDPINFLQLYRDATGGRNYPGWEDGRYQHQLEMAMRSSNMTQRKQHYLEAEKLLMDQMVVAPISFPASSYLCRDRLKGVYCNPMGYIDLHWAYVE